MSSSISQQDVLAVSEIDIDHLQQLYTIHGLELKAVAESDAIPGSHWGDNEAGLIKHTLYYRNDTPVHSILHEGGHWLMMDDVRRNALHTDAKGSQAEENAVCYLQILMADLVPQMGRERMFADMDSWGYSFRLGSAAKWFFEDAEDARDTLMQALKSKPLLVQQLGVTDVA